jgi:hypothetical protein
MKTFFMDLRFVSILMTIWLLIVICIMIEIGIFANSDFVSFGPRAKLSFMKVPIDTYYKYNMLIAMIILHTFITDFIADSLSPHVLNVVQDPKTKVIPHRPQTYIIITTIWALYCSITQLFAIFIAFAQLDLLLVRLASDIIANILTTSLYLHGKEYNPSKIIVLGHHSFSTSVDTQDSEVQLYGISTSRDPSLECNDRDKLLTSSTQLREPTQASHT